MSDKADEYMQSFCVKLKTNYKPYFMVYLGILRTGIVGDMKITPTTKTRKFPNCLTEF